MTEDEAKKKWCPYATHHAKSCDYDLSCGRCIASDCMMWRMGYEHQAIGEEAPDSGYCGLGGEI